jgi:hypothetical protein
MSILCIPQGPRRLTCLAARGFTLLTCLDFEGHSLILLGTSLASAVSI